MRYNNNNYSFLVPLDSDVFRFAIPSGLNNHKISLFTKTCFAGINKIFI